MQSEGLKKLLNPLFIQFPPPKGIVIDEEELNRRAEIRKK